MSWPVALLLVVLSVVLPSVPRILRMRRRRRDRNWIQSMERRGMLARDGEL